MLTLTFKSADVFREIGPAAWIELRGRELHTSVHAKPVAYYQHGGWFTNGSRAALFECRALTSVQLLYPGDRMLLGPFSHLVIRDRHLFGGRAPLAKLLPGEKNWFHAESARFSEVLRVMPFVVAKLT